MLFIDTETRSAVSLGTRSVTPYVSCPHFKLMIVTWAINDSEVFIWEPDENPIPDRLKKALEDENENVVMANSMFDRRVLAKAGVANINPKRIFDTMVQAYSHALPGNLKALSEIFRLGESGKKDVGRTLINTFCKPILVKDNKKGGDVEIELGVHFNDKTTYPEAWEEFREYARVDVEAMRKLFKLMPQINYPLGFEHTLWVYDQKMIDRGILLDVALAEKAVELFEETKEASKKKIQEMTNQEVDSPTKVKQMITYLNTAYGMELTDLKKATVTTLLKNPDLPCGARLLLAERSEVGKATPAKFKKMIQCASDQGRIHDTIQFAGAGRTGRDAGRIFQPQNLMRPNMWNNLSGEALSKAIDIDAAIITKGCGGMFYLDPVNVLSNLIRSALIAPKGKKLVVSDLSNIEGRTLAWLANEQWKVQYFRDFDSGVIQYDNYVMTYAKAFNVPPSEVTSHERSIGKVMELALGYGGGVAAFTTMATAFNVDLKALAKSIFETATDTELLRYCQGDKYTWMKERNYHADLPVDIFAACEYIKVKWRESHPNIVNMWKNLEKAFLTATITPDIIVPVKGTLGKLKFKRSKSWLYLRLPSGRCLTFLNPKTQAGKNLSFTGVDQKTKSFKSIFTYSGKLAENVASATARDVMFHSIPLIESNGYEIVFRVHDEICAETPDLPEYSSKHLSNLMTTPHSWCEDLPLAASGFESNRYRGKD